MATSAVRNRQLGWRQRFPNVSWWAAAAIATTLALAVYYSALGARSWEISKRTASLNEQMARSSAALAAPPPQESSLTAELQHQEQRLEELRHAFNPEPEGPVAVLDAVAQDSELNLTSIALGEISPVTQGNIQYQTQSVTVAISGDLQNIYKFLSLVQQNAPIAAITSIRIAGFSSSTSAQVSLLFHLSPSPVAAKGGKTK